MQLPKQHPLAARATQDLMVEAEGGAEGRVGGSLIRACL